MTRHVLFKNYWWLGLLLGGTAATSAYFLGGESRVGLVGAAIAGTLGFYYFIQQQKLAETRLFYELFTAFNARYNELNDTLSELAARGGTKLSTSERNLIVDYFNLCAEEYLFFKEGYIHRDVWESWCRGMLWYLRRHPFRDIWHDEINSESYYGLTLFGIEEGANWKNKQ